MCASLGADCGSGSNSEQPARVLCSAARGTPAAPGSAGERRGGALLASPASTSRLARALPRRALFPPACRGLARSRSQLSVAATARQMAPPSIGRRMCETFCCFPSSVFGARFLCLPRSVATTASNLAPGFLFFLSLVFFLHCF